MTTTETATPTPTTNGFASLGLGPQIEATLARLGITEPSPVQLQAIPLLLAGKDLIASAPTGTGKTAAFVLPALVRLQQAPTIRSAGPRVLILTPTRELAQQVAQAAKNFSGGLPRIKTVCVTGGESYREQNRILTAPHEIMVATPGRLMDQMQSGRIDFSRLEMLVLDEADRMLDMGFSEDVMAIAAKLPSDRLTVCFSATLSRSVMQLSNQLQRSAQTIEVKAAVSTVDAIDQQIIYVDNFGHKRRLLSHWLSGEASGQTVIFTATKRDAEALAEALDAEGHSTVALHGDLQQRQRTRMLNQLRRGEARVLVATDVAARGIDVPSITHVFNFDLPRFAEDYVHRIGRTGRAGATGVAVSFVGREDVGVLRRIEQFIGRRVKVSEVEGMKAQFDPADRRPGGRPGAGPRRFDDRRPGGGFGDRRPQGGFGGRRDEGSSAPRQDAGERRPFGDRSAASAERKPWGDRPAFGDRKPQGERPSFGAPRDGFAKRESFGGRDGAAPRAAYGDRPRSEGFGERKSFGDRKPAGFGGDRPRRKFD